MDRERLLRTFLDLVAVDSPTGHEGEIGRVLEARFRELGCTTSMDEIGNIVAVYPGTREGTILVSTHMDTAGTDRGIVPIIGDDGVIRTDGSTILGADDKSGLAGCLELLDPAAGEPGHARTRRSSSSSRWGRRAAWSALVRWTSAGSTPRTASCSTPQASWARSPTGRRRRSYLTVTFHGRKAHAGVEPEKGVSAIQVAADAIAAMTLGRIDEETVANIGTISGGEARNIIPDTAVLLGMARSHDQAKLDAQLAAMRRACEDAAAARGATVEFEAEEIYRTYKIAEDARPYREAAAAIRSLGLEVVARKSGGGTDGNYFNAKGIPCVALSTGMVDEHATTEHIAIDDLVLAAKTLVAIATLPPQEEEPTS